MIFGVRGKLVAAVKPITMPAAGSGGDGRQAQAPEYMTF
jgi:hypothetical protein